MDDYSGAWRPVSLVEWNRLKANGEKVSWAEGVGLIVYDDIALRQTRAEAAKIATTSNLTKNVAPSPLLSRYRKQSEEAARIMERATDYARSIGCEVMHDEILVKTQEQLDSLARWWSENSKGIV